MQILYDTIGVGYNETRRADAYLTGRFSGLLAPEDGKNFLDVGCGTGNYTCALAVNGYQFYGLEPSETMLNVARSKCSNVVWRRGAAEDIPFEDDFFDGATACLTIHHWKNLSESFRELNRVLKTQSKFVAFTSFPEQMEGYWLNFYFPQMLRDSIAQMPEFSTIEVALKEAGFEITTVENYFVRDDLQDFFLYCGKHRPELYLREEIRKGISSFSALAHREEVETGLRRLAHDIETGKISEVIKNSENASGDYAFLVLTKIGNAV